MEKGITFICYTTDDDIEQGVIKVLPKAKIEDLGREDGNFIYRVTNPKPLTKKEERVMETEFGANFSIADISDL